MNITYGDVSPETLRPTVGIPKDIPLEQYCKKDISIPLLVLELGIALKDIKPINIFTCPAAKKLTLTTSILKIDFPKFIATFPFYASLNDKRMDKTTDDIVYNEIFHTETSIPATYGFA